MSSRPDPDEYTLRQTYVSFLRAALKQDGTVKFRDRHRLGLSRKQMDYRFKRLKKDGLIEVHKETKEENEHGGSPQRVAELTDVGKAIIQDWLQENPVDIQSVEAAGEEFVTKDFLRGELSEMGQRVNWTKEDAKDARNMAEEALNHSQLMEKFILHIARQLDMKEELIRLKMREDAQ